MGKHTLVTEAGNVKPQANNLKKHCILVVIKQNEIKLCPQTMNCLCYQRFFLRFLGLKWIFLTITSHYVDRQQVYI